MTMKHPFMRILCVCCIATLSACVPTDDPRDDDGFTSYVPDMSHSGDMDGGDLGEKNASANNATSGDMNVTTPGSDMGGDVIDMNVNNTSPGDMGTPNAEPLVCRPNKDGVITRQEVPLRSGLRATYKVANDTPVDTAGEMGENGERIWDLNVDLADDHLVIVEARDPKNKWFSTDFPDASYITPLSDSSDLLGVFQITDDALLLLGVVSPDDGFYETNLTYDPPVEILSFPLEMDASWTTDASVSGTAQGVYSIYDEEYSSQVDAKGTLRTPYGDLEVLRVRVELDRTIGFYTTKIRTYAFVSECFGTVATIVSEDDEDEVEFTTASEVRRLAQ